MTTRIEKLRRQIDSMSVHGGKGTGSRKHNLPKQPYRRTTQHYPSHGVENACIKEDAAVVLSEEMQERERIAQQEIERKKQRVAPLYNKGGLQYITPEFDIKDLGRK